MLGFVRQVTGRPHLEVMAVLLREATGDKGLKRQEAGGPVARPPETSPGLAQALLEPRCSRSICAPAQENQWREIRPQKLIRHSWLDKACLGPLPFIR